MKVALVHDYLREFGGAERVVEVLHEIFPDAPLYTAYYNPKSLGSHADRFKGWDIKTSWIQHIPLANKLVSPFRILAPSIFNGFNLDEYDLVISSSSIYFAKNINTKGKHIAYIHTPPRYLYGYTTSFNYKKNIFTKVIGELMNHVLRIWDFEASQKPDILVANSKNVQNRIKKFYRRDSEIVYPPIDTDRFKSAQTAAKGDYYLSIGRLVRGKGTEVIVEACTRTKVSLKVAGTGPQLEYLKQIAGKNVEFLGSVTDMEAAALYANAKATIVASEDEDFGIVPVESMASGTPVIAPKAGGFLETVIGGKTGEFFSPVSVDALEKALKNFDSSKYSYDDCIKQAQKFSKNEFKAGILQIVDKLVG